MKGVVFTEFLELVEEKFGYATVDHIIERSELSNDGAYTSVGTYDYHDLIRMVVELSQITGSRVPDLVKFFGHHMFHVFTKAYPELLRTTHCTFEFLPHVEKAIHVEMRKLYSDAELPSFRFEYPADNEIVMYYQSTRPFADLAEGLIEACAEHFGEPVRIQREDLAPHDGTQARFAITKL
ncbi:MAG: heme NO-binding domain-containing protein [Planctomycetales bacterium]|nr:heme NO-binding domain-containing protein [Planctomycetales bacterium]